MPDHLSPLGLAPTAGRHDCGGAGADASGFYRPISEAFAGRSLIMLAVLAGAPGSAEQQRYRIFRPCSGPAVKLLDHNQMKSR